MLESLGSGLQKKELPPIQKIPEELRNILAELEHELGGNAESSSELLKNITEYFSEHGGMLEPDFSRYIHRIAAEYPGLIVRREDPSALLRALETGESIPIRFHGEAHGGAAYPNAGVLGWDASGLSIPYQRGFGKIGDGKIVLVTGFVPNEQRVHVDSLPIGSYPHYNNPGERENIRMVEGDVDTKNDLKFVSIRFPRSLFPESQMTEAELDNENVFHISRLYSFNSALKKETDH